MTKLKVGSKRFTLTKVVFRVIELSCAMRDNETKRNETLYNI